MDASLLFPTFHRLLRGLRVLPGRPHPAGARTRQAHAAAPIAAVRPAAAAPVAASRPVAAVQALPQQAFTPRPLSPRALPIPPAAAAARAPASPVQALAHNSVAARSLRTLEEVRADLARLREQAKKRHAVEVHIRRDNSFAPTDFMDFGKPAKAPEPASAQAPFASTDFLDFTVLKPR